MSVLARADGQQLQAAWDDLGATPEIRTLRAPETGLVMVRGRAGGDGTLAETVRLTTLEQQRDLLADLFIAQGHGAACRYRVLVRVIGEGYQRCLLVLVTNQQADHDAIEPRLRHTLIGGDFAF